MSLLDGRSLDLHLDSASTSAEVCRVLADQIDLRDTYGFSLYVSLFDKVAFKFIRFCFQLVLASGRGATDPMSALFLADVVPGQLREPRAGRGLSV